MFTQKCRIFLFSLISLTIAVALGIFWLTSIKGKFYLGKKSREQSAQLPKENIISTDLQHHIQKRYHQKLLKREGSPEQGSYTLRRAAPLYHPSAEELRDFPNCFVEEYSICEGPTPDTLIHLRVLKTDFKDPYVRTEELINRKNEELISREEMAADKLMIMPKKKEDLEQIAATYHFNRQDFHLIDPDLQVYRLDLKDHQLAAFTNSLALLSDSQAKPVVEPDSLSHSEVIDSDPVTLFAEGKASPYHITAESYPPHTDFVDWQWGNAQSYKIANSEQTYFGSGSFSVLENFKHSPPIIVAILDSGVDFTHPDLEGKLWHNPHPNGEGAYGKDCYYHQGNLMDECGHGTKCAGIIGAAHRDGGGVAGVIDNVELMICRAASNTGVMDDDSLIEGLAFIRNTGPQILSISYGSSGYSQIRIDAFKKILDKNIIVVAAAGNDNLNIDFFPSLEALSDDARIIVVAALTSSNQLADFSNYGPSTVQLAAPGEDILTTNTQFSGNKYSICRGTSFAAPYVAGALALLKEKYSNQPNHILIRHLLGTTRPMNALKDKVSSGGALDIEKAMRESLWGSWWSQRTMG